MRNPQRQAHFYFALLMAIILALPILGLLSESAVGDTTTTATKVESGSLQPEQLHIWKAGLVAGAIFANANLTDSQITVEVSGNQLTLRGSVQTEEQRALAEQIAMSVVTEDDEVFNELSISTPARTSPGKTEAARAKNETRGGLFTDAAVTTKVKSQLLANHQTSALDIDVSTFHQAVTLSGDVGSDIEKDLAYYITRNTEGVGAIINKLEVKPSQP